MKKVCMIIQHHFFPPHSRTYDKAKILSSNGYEVITLTLGKENLKKEEVLEYSKVKRTFDRGIRKPKLPIINNPFLVFKLFSEAKRTNADVYHICDMDDILVGFLLKHILDKNVIYDIGDDFPSYNNFPGFVQSMIRALEGHLSKSYDTIIVLSKSLKKDRVKYTPKINVIYYSPDPSFNPDNVMNDQMNSDYVLIFEGQIHSKKGVIEVIEALSLVLREIKSVKLLLIGEIREETEKEKIMSLIDKYGLKDHIKFIDWVKHTEVPKFINLGDVGIIIFKPWSYSYITGVPNKLIEYMACGKPVISSKNFPEIENIVKSAKCGILVDHDDPKKIAEAISYLLKNEEIRTKMGKNARSYVEKNHNWHSFEKKLLEIYNGLGP